MNRTVRRFFQWMLVVSLTTMLTASPLSAGWGLHRMHCHHHAVHWSPVHHDCPPTPCQPACRPIAQCCPPPGCCDGGPTWSAPPIDDCCYGDSGVGTAPMTEQPWGEGSGDAGARMDDPPVEQPWDESGADEAPPAPPLESSSDRPADSPESDSAPGNEAPAETPEPLPAEAPQPQPAEAPEPQPAEAPQDDLFGDPAAVPADQPPTEDPFGAPPEPPPAEAPPADENLDDEPMEDLFSSEPDSTPADETPADGQEQPDADAALEDIFGGDDASSTDGESPEAADDNADDNADQPADEGDDDLSDIFGSQPSSDSTDDTTVTTPSDELPDLPEDLFGDPDESEPDDSEGEPGELEQPDEEAGGAADAADEALDELFGESADEDESVGASASIDDLFGAAPVQNRVDFVASPNETAFNDARRHINTAAEPQSDRLQGTQVRIWVDNTGNYSTRGRLIEINRSQVRLLKTNGRTCTVPYTRLSAVDTAYLAALDRRLAGVPLMASAGEK